VSLQGESLHFGKPIPEDYAEVSSPARKKFRTFSRCLPDVTEHLQDVKNVALWTGPQKLDGFFAIPKPEFYLNKVSSVEELKLKPKGAEPRTIQDPALGCLANFTVQLHGVSSMPRFCCVPALTGRW
jgi:hypothetical protein